MAKTSASVEPTLTGSGSVEAEETKMFEGDATADILEPFDEKYRSASSASSRRFSAVVAVFVV